MKRILLALALTTLAASSFAGIDSDAAATALHNECAAKYSAKLDVKASEANEFHFVYAKGEYKGGRRPLDGEAQQHYGQRRV